MISLVIPCYNEARLLPRLLDSVDAARAAYRGDPAGVEVIIADNGSTDRTREIPVARGCRLAVTADKNIGANRNAGARLARGELLAFVDADTRIHPETFNGIGEVLGDPRVIAGTSGVTMERWSPGIATTYAMMLPMVWITNTGVLALRRLGKP